jgi:ferritin-like protein
MIDEQRRRDRELLLKRLRELDQEITEDQRELWELQKREAARLPPDKHLGFYLERALEIISSGSKCRITSRWR